mmetsp:Transcript_11802/g.11738  ORF Transcript_11802/g.11738 Transcript_11802/m.11738 type:complete len:85 (-) Transcript_11802:32-286(-)
MQWGQFYIAKGLEAFEQLLKETKGKYCVGDELTLADVFLIPQLYNADRFSVDLKVFPNILQVRETLEALPQFQKAHPSAQPDAE